MNTPNRKLSIAIPTYNRAGVLETNIREMLPELKKYQIELHISDDSTNFDTKLLVSNLLQEYPHINYRHNKPNLGHDANFRATVSMPKTEYVWYLGDARRIRRNGIGSALHFLEKDPDFCFVNHHTSDFSNREINPADMHQFLLDRAWYLTLTGATIYGQRPLELLANLPYIDSRRNFPQLELILAFIERTPTRAMWCGTPYLSTAPESNGSSYWMNTAFSVFMRDWMNLIQAHPKLFSPEEMNEIIRTHSVHSGLFGVKGLVLLRTIGALDRDIMQEYALEFPIASQVDIRLATLISMLPKGPLAMSYKFLRSIFRTIPSE